jgi:hypothetical protein
MRPADLPPADRFPHGTRARYIAGRCRCLRCRAANARYSSARQYASTHGDWNGLVPADRARQHLRWLSRHGVGRRAVAAASDVAASALAEIRAGRQTQIRARTERRILAVDLTCIADHALVPSSGAWQLLARLIAHGYPKARIAKALGLKRPALQFDPTKPMTAATVLRIERTYRELLAL